MPLFLLIFRTGNTIAKVVDFRSVVSWNAVASDVFGIYVVKAEHNTVFRTETIAMLPPAIVPDLIPGIYAFEVLFKPVRCVGGANLTIGKSNELVVPGTKCLSLSANLITVSESTSTL